VDVPIGKQEQKHIAAGRDGFHAALHQLDVVLNSSAQCLRLLFGLQRAFESLLP
jgi:hypothetical protein